MKIYLGFTVAGDRSSVEAAKKILGVLQSMGHEVLTSHLVREDAWHADRLGASGDFRARYSVARAVRPLCCRGLWVVVWFGLRDRLPPRCHAEEDHSLLPTRRGAQDFSFDRGEYASQLHLGPLLRA